MKNTLPVNHESVNHSSAGTQDMNIERSTSNVEVGLRRGSPTALRGANLDNSQAICCKPSLHATSAGCDRRRSRSMSIRVAVRYSHGCLWQPVSRWSARPSYVHNTLISRTLIPRLRDDEVYELIRLDSVQKGPGTAREVGWSSSQSSSQSKIERFPIRINEIAPSRDDFDDDCGSNYVTNSFWTGSS